MTSSGLSLTGAAASNYQLLPTNITANILPAPTTTTLDSPVATTTSAGTTYTLTAQINGAINGATGDITFRDNGVGIAGGANIALTNGQATFVTPVLSNGNHTFTTTFNSGSNLIRR